MIISRLNLKNWRNLRSIRRLSSLASVVNAVIGVVGALATNLVVDGLGPEHRTANHIMDGSRGCSLGYERNGIF